MNPAILDFGARVVFFPVRHHSPACARAVREFARELRPARVLIEGPSDFNGRLDELFLAHELPIAIYSWANETLSDGTTARRGAFYPFCDYSPEWVALRAAREVGAQARFIDLPWRSLARSEAAAHRYAEPELRASPYVAALCQKTGAPDLDALWDRLFEIENLSARALWERCHHFCFGVRVTDGAVSPEDLAREAWMAGQIEAATQETTGRILVVTGGFHSYALWARLHGEPFDSPGAQGNARDEEPTDSVTNRGDAESKKGDAQNQQSEGENNRGDAQDKPADSVTNRGNAESEKGDAQNQQSEGENNRIAAQDKPADTENNSDDADDHQGEAEQSGLALTPYSYERLDALRGYEAGMPSPGFYEAVWREREGGREERGVARELLALTAKSLRKRKQIASSADLIAVMATAQALADLRGHAQVWRRDLVDGVIGALVKDELVGGSNHPFLDAVHDALRGHAHGKIAFDAPLAPLVADVQSLLRDLDLEVVAGERSVELDLFEARDLKRSRALHRLRSMGIAGFARAGGTDFSARDDLSRARETWTLKWTPETLAGATEASLYGATLRDAAIARLAERAANIERDAGAGALLLLDAALMGLPDIAPETLARLVEVVRDESDFFRLAPALEHLLYLFFFDEALGTRQTPELGVALREAWERGAWLLETLGSPQNRDRELLSGVRSLVRTLERCEDALDLERDGFVAVLGRIGAGTSHGALLRGASAGALWTMGAVSFGQTLGALPAFAAPDQLGDFLTGLFALAREAAQREPALVASIDALLGDFDDERFLEALPSLRLAFSFFTPREKYHLALTLLGDSAGPPPDLEVSVEVATRALQLESRVLATLKRFGLRPLKES